MLKKVKCPHITTFFAFIMIWDTHFLTTEEGKVSAHVWLVRH